MLDVRFGEAAETAVVVISAAEVLEVRSSGDRKGLCEAAFAFVLVPLAALVVTAGAVVVVGALVVDALPAGCAIVVSPGKGSYGGGGSSGSGSISGS